VETTSVAHVVVAAGLHEDGSVEAAPPGVPVEDASVEAAAVEDATASRTSSTASRYEYHIIVNRWGR
jgi:hypothetical protein